MDIEKIFIASISIIFMLVVASPVIENWKDEPKDDFPLSYFPMFTTTRGEKTFVSHLYGVDKDNNYYTIPNDYVIPGVGFNSARKQIRRIIQNNQSLELCESTAKILSTEDVEPYNRIKHLSVVTSIINIDVFMKNSSDYFPTENIVYATCVVR